MLGLEESLQRDLGRGGEIELADAARVHEHDLAALVALDVVIGEVGAHHEQPELVVAVGVLVVDRELAEQLQAVREPDAGLLRELAVRAGEKVLARVEVPADESPLLRVDGRELVALLQQDPPPGVDQDDAREPLHPADAIAPGG